jgi:ribosomal RNA assembly protein
MRRIHFFDKELWRILTNERRNIKRLEKEFDVKIDIKKGEHEADFIIKAKSAVQEHIILEILEALASGFSFDIAILIKEEDFVFKKINLKNYVHGSRLEVIKGRIIGKEGKAKKVIQNLSECFLCLCDNNVSIIGKAENVELASRAIESLIKGSKHANVFKLLEKSRVSLKEQEMLAEELEREFNKKK